MKRISTEREVRAHEGAVAKRVIKSSKPRRDVARKSA
jgi:hypothetical protein